MSLLGGNDDNRMGDVEDMDDDSALDTLLHTMETVEAYGKLCTPVIACMKLLCCKYLRNCNN